MTFGQSRWPAADTSVNSHGDVLREFVADHPAATHLWFVDADIFFTTPDCLGVMLAELDDDPSAWAVQARFEWVEQNVGTGASKDIWAGRKQQLWATVGGAPERPFYGQHKPRCHPGCALVANTPVFHRVADIIGLSAGMIIGMDETSAGFADTFGLASLAMATHNQRYLLSAVTVGHYHGVSYFDPANPLDMKRAECRRRLAAIRAGETFTPGPFG
ncbi:hypothetical protein [Actinopolymorpha alba]|uniref:hypothetical protein n=1 Tax=Actinopolymorpha alba TaxID=533267 RepID=UPI000363DB1A|nr:hypothetical protein [Actinopolymorpha alba]